jgi:spore germination protein GerM
MKKLAAAALLVGLGAAVAFGVARRGSEGAVSLGPPPQETRSTSGSDGTATGAGTVPATLSVEVWFARRGRLVPALRTHSATPRVATAALGALLAGPTRAERASGLTTAIPAGTRLLGISIHDGVAKVDLTSEYQSGGGSLSMQVRLGQVVYTLTQFPTIRAVRFALDGAPVNVFSSEGIVLDHAVGRGDYKELSSTASPPAGSWRRLPEAPVTPDFDSRTSVWTGRQLLVFGRDQLTALDPRGHPYSVGSANVAAAYDRADNTWRRLSPPPEPGYSPGRPTAVWTGKEMLVGDLAFDPEANRWRRLPPLPSGARGGSGVVVWTGRELIGWGGGCCGDAFSGGVAYSPTANTWRTLARSPLAGSQHPTGVWTGRELILFVSGFDPEGKRWPPRLARAAAYDPATHSWRRIAPLPAPRDGATAVWDGHEVLVVGGVRAAAGGRPPVPAEVGFAYDPATNRWRRLAPMEPGRTGALGIWTGKRLLVWGGQTGRPPRLRSTARGLLYDPETDRWAALPRAPLPDRLEPTAVWTGRSLIVWGGVRTATWGKYGAAGAMFTPTTP